MEAYFIVKIWHKGIMSSIMFEDFIKMLDFIKEEKENPKCNAIQAYVRMESLTFRRNVESDYAE